MKRSRSPNSLFIVVCVLTLALLVHPASTILAGKNGLQSAWERAREAGDYEFIADVEQTLIPRPLPSMIGQTDERVDIRVEGEVTLPDYARLQLRFEGGGLDVPSLGLIQDGTDSFLLKDGEKIPIENPTALSSPTADYLGYLAAAENVKREDVKREGMDSGFTQHVSRFTFDINGQRLAAYVRDQTEAHLRDSGQPLPAGVELEPSPLLERMTGHGELWVDANGLPRRQVMDLETPEITEQYDARIHLIVDFDFGESANRQISKSTNNLINTLTTLALRIAPSDVLCLMVALVLAAALTTSGRRRWVYALTAISVSIIMVASPLLQVDGVLRFQTRLAEAAESTQTITEALGLPPDSADPTQYAEQSRIAHNTQYPISNTSSPNLQSAVQDPQSMCGSGTPGEDTDSDGLEDVTEYCLGTDPFSTDSDKDLITDTLEIEGFDWGGKHWTSNPTDSDSNEDGLADFSEWPAPQGEAPGWDPDGDGVPNLWDADNDDDGVPDDLDLAPFSRTDYQQSFSLSTQGGDFDGYQYIELQIQPQNADHLRYTTTIFDWIYDEAGQIQDLDNSIDDLGLVPMLKIRTDDLPETELARNYGVSTFKENGVTYLYAPLMPIGDGGQIVGFYAKVAYSPGGLDDIRWEGIELVWMVRMNLDQDVGGRLVTNLTPIHFYTGEAFRIAGLQIVKSKDSQSVILGTPTFPNDGQRLFNVLLGISATFLHNQTPDLQTIATRFDNPNTPIEETWGVPATDVTVEFHTYGHSDEATADMAALIPRFLNDEGYPTDSEPSLIAAFQDELGAYNLDDLCNGQAACPPQPGEPINVNLANVHMTTQRGLKRTSYTYQSDNWQAMTLEGTVEMVLDRYDDLSGDLATLQAEYPELTEDDLQGVLVTFYSVWHTGYTCIMALDGQPLFPDNRSDLEVYGRLHQPVDGLPAYLIEAGELAQTGGGLKIGYDQYQAWAYERDQDWAYDMTGLSGKESDTFGLLRMHTDAPEESTSFVTLLVKAIKKTVKAIQKIQKAVQLAHSLQTATSSGWTKWLKLGQRKKAAFMAVVAVVIIWVTFALTTDFSNPVVLYNAIALAVVQTALTITLFIISLNPIGAIIAAVISLIDIIIMLATFGKWSIARAITEMFYKREVLTYLGDVDFNGLRTVPLSSERGIAVGGGIRVTDYFRGTIEATSDGDDDDLEDSYVRGEFAVSAEGAIAGAKTLSEYCSIWSNVKACYNALHAEYLFYIPQVNAKLSFQHRVRAVHYDQECGLWGLICSRKKQKTNLPEDLDGEDKWGWEDFYVDVLPATLDGLLTWEYALDNPDRDGDELHNLQEDSLGTDPDDWDTDGDGLSDKFEIDVQHDLGTDPLDDDTDGDGLSDGFEYRVRTRVDNPDSDGDGLLDSEEVYHQDATGQWVGGWLVNLPDVAQPQTAWVFSDPLQADADGDNLNDLTERANNTSPYAFNDAPRLTLEADPLAANPDGTVGAYVEPGDEVVLTLSLDSIGPRPVDSTLTLCLPDFLTDLQGGNLQGDRTPPREPAPNCNGFQWSFDGQYTLQFWESVSTTITSRVSASLGASVSDQATATLPYQVTDQLEDITTHVPVAVDVDDPQVTIVAPADGDLLGGGISSYVMGGSANDATSWVTRVDLNLPGVGTVTAEDISPWAYTWNLPADGVYNLTATSYDYLGHASPPDTVQVTVDNTAPGVDLDLADGAYVTGQSGQVITVSLTGSASDNLSGLTRVQVSTDGKPWREVWSVGQVGNLTYADWSTDWELPDEESAQGKHTVSVRAFDQAGNESVTLERTIIVDVVPPTDELTSRTYLSDPPHNPTGEALTFHGVANDAGNVPQPSRPAELVGELDGISDATIWLGLSSIDENDAWVSVAWLGDFNGDRLADLAVGLPAAADGDGQVTVVYGSAGGWPVPSDLEMLAESRTSFVGKTGAGIGGSLAAAGDVNGDGYDDLLIGDAANDRVYLVFGHPSPMGRNLLLDEPESAVWSELTAPEGEQIGEWLGAAGDVNGDGYDDLLIGVTGAEGKAYLLLGQAPSLWWETMELDVHAAAVIGTDAAGARLTGVGDMDNDQYDEFAVADGTTVYLFEGQGDFAPRAGESLALGDAIDTFASSDVRPEIAALGDVNDDDMADFIYANGDQPQVVFGDANQSWGGQAISGHTPAPSGFLAAPGDVDADGLDDLLIGNADDNAYLILGSDLNTVEATLTGVEIAASAPYAAGADLNSDASSDLLLVPTEAAAADKGLACVSFGETPYVSPQSLPVAPSYSPPLRSGEGLGEGAKALATHTVDDDGGADFTNIQAAIDAASAGDTINVLPGVYAAFTIVGKNNLTVSGVHADAVFVEGDGGSHAARIESATGVTLENLTLLDATNAVVLHNAGFEGWQAGHESDRINLTSLLIYDFTGHAVYMDRLSTADLTRCTLAGGDNHIEVYGDLDPAMEANWSTISTDGRTATNEGGGLTRSGDTLYFVHGDGSTTIDSYTLGSGWGSQLTAPRGFDKGSAVVAGDGGDLWALRADEFLGGFNGTVHAIAYVSEDEIYVGGEFTHAGSTEANYIAEWDGSEWKPLGADDPKAPAPNPWGDDYHDYVYAIAVNGNNVYVGGRFGLKRWTEGAWEDLGSLDWSSTARGVYALAIDGNDVYVGGDWVDIKQPPNDDLLGANEIARWNNGWYNVAGTGLKDDWGYVRSLAVDSNYVYVGGRIPRDLPDPCDYGQGIARLNKSNDSWEGVGSGSDCCSGIWSGSAPNYTTGAWVESLDLMGNKLVVGGHFTYVANGCGSEQAANNLAFYNTSSNSWEPQSYLSTDGDVRAIRVSGNDIYIGGEFTQVGGSTSASYVARLDASGDWHSLGNSVDNSVYAVAHDGSYTYVGGAFAHTDDGTESGPVSRFARWDSSRSQWSGQFFYQYSGGSWSLKPEMPFWLGGGATAVSIKNGSYAGYLFALAGGGSGGFYRFKDGNWVSMTNLGQVGEGAALVEGNLSGSGYSYIYASRGGDTPDFYRYDPNMNNWTTLAPLPDPIVFSSGTSLAWDGRDCIYAFAGGNGKQFLRFHVTNEWQVLGDGSDLSDPPDKDTPYNINAGGGLVYTDQALYGIPGGGEPQLWRYDPVAIYPEKLTLDNVAFVVPETTADSSWYNLDLISQPDDFMLVGHHNDWVAGSGITWSPSALWNPYFSGSSQLTHDQAQFVDADRDVYRIRDGSVINAGYHTYRATAYVAPSGAEFTNIQDAILSDANTVVVKPGQYPQSFYLISGVNVLGSRADQTILEAPPDHTTPLVSAEGVVGARLSGFTLAGDGTQDGLSVEDGAQSLTFARNIVRGTQTGISVVGDDTDLEVVNNTIVDNTDGMVASDCAPVDVRNTIFAYHSGTGLTYDDCAVTKLHTYNDFWANDTDLSPAKPGAGELFLDPMFVDRFAHDYRTVDGSPVIDAGNPSDPAPPGTGDRVDIGYIEQGRAAFYADDDYCETCPNDGLTWQVDAFDVIQDALDAAADDMAALEATESPPQYAVGVGAGTYHTETVTIPGYVRLVGSGAEDTTIDAGGSGSPVTFDGVVQAEVTGFTLTGAGSPGVAVLGASNSITVTRNIIRDNPTGVAFSGRASGLVTFNTLVDNSGDGVSSSGYGSWVTVESNILSDNGTGLHTLDQGHIFNEYNLLNNTTNYDDEAGTGLVQGLHELVDVDPLFVDPGADNYRLQATSPAVDAASPFAEVPAGGGEYADQGYRELLAAPVTLFLGKEDVSTATGNSGANEVEVGITLVADPSSPVTDTIPSTWSAVTLDSPGETVSYWQTDYVPAAEGLHRFYSRATDVVGNQETNDEDWYEGAFVADDTPPDVTWLKPDLPATSSPLELRAQVSDYAAGEFSVEDIHFEVDGVSYSAEWAAVPWDEESGDPRVFRAWVSLASTPSPHTAYAVAEDKAGNVGQSDPVAFTVTTLLARLAAADTTSPTLTVSSPAEGSWVRDTVDFSGTVQDDESGVESVEVSVDGGTSWMPAEVSGGDWSLTWETPEGQESVSYPGRVRATDLAGNVTLPQTRTFTVDNVAPTGLAPITFSAPQNTHFDTSISLTIEWSAPEDGSGTAETVLAVDQVSDTTPSVVVGGTTATVDLNADGEWYVHLGAEDAAGNQLTRHFGPWYVGILDLPCDQRQQSIVLDGYLDLENDEWLDTEFLDDDERPVVENPNAETQELYATWDGEAFYLGWQGAWWTLDGTLWAYLDTGPGGTNQIPSIQYLLPFDADYAIEVTSPTTGTLWTYNGGWQSAALDFGHDETGGTEARIPLDIPAITNLQLLAFALGDDGEPWSVFPTTNQLEGPWNDAYHWNDPCSVTAPNDGQPRGVTVVMALTSPQAPQATWGPNNSLEYVVDLTNYEDEEVADLRLAFNATAGLAYQPPPDGATCADCAADDYWLLNVPALPEEASHRVTVTGTLAADLSSFSEVTTTVELQFDTTRLAANLSGLSEAQALATATLIQAALSHQVDGQPPTVSISPAGETLKPGLQTIYGEASDGDGVGVAGVECREAITGTWQDADGTLLWACDIVVPPTFTFQLEARATDEYSQTSDVVSAEFTVDPTPPAVNWSLPAILSGDHADVGGTTTDPYPDGSEVNQVDVQLDQDTNPWRTGEVYAPDASGDQDWLWTWALPREDGVTHNLRARATDAAGNETATLWQSTLVDTVAPEVTVATVISNVDLVDYQPGSVTGPPILEGTASDGDSVDDAIVHVNLPNGDSYQDAATYNGSEWSYTPELTQCGHHTLRLEVTDQAGNATLKGAFDLFVNAPEFTTAFVTAQPSNSVNLTARVSNDGSKQAAAGVSVAFYLGDPEVGGTLIGMTTTQALDPGEWEDVSVNWDWDTPGDHDIYIVVDDDGTGTSQVVECEEDNNTTHHIVSIVDVPLVESWNLVSAYVNPFNTDTSVVQIPIEGQYTVIHGFDGGAQSYYLDLPPAVNTLKNVDGEHGYWVKVKEGLGRTEENPSTGLRASSGELRGSEQVATWRMVGTKLAEDQAIELDVGWNLVSYLPRQPLAVADALQSIDGRYTAVLGFDQGALSYYPDIDPSFNTLHEMEPLFGYWIKMDRADTLQYPATTQGTANVSESPPNSPEPALSVALLTVEGLPRVSPSSTWVNFYGPTLLPVGSVVQATDPDGVVCGATMVTHEGQYGLLACYGDDPTTLEDEGARPGDIIELVVDGQTLNRGMYTVQGDLHWVPLGTAPQQQVFLPLVQLH